MNDLSTTFPEPATEIEELARRVKARRMITYLLLFAIVMFFAGLSSAYVVSLSNVDFWVRITIPGAFYISTAAILVSSVFAQWALISTRQGRNDRTVGLLGITLLLGLVFCWSQFQGWKELKEMGNYLSFSKLEQLEGVYGEDYSITYRGQVLQKEDGNYYLPEDMARERPLNSDMAEVTNQAGQYFYALTAAHLAHLFLGLLALVVTIITALRGRYTATAHTGLWANTLYWHFLGGLWVYLLLFLAIIH